MPRLLAAGSGGCAALPLRAEETANVRGSVRSKPLYIDSIAAVPVGERNRPVADVKIIQATLIKRQ